VTAIRIDGELADAATSGLFWESAIG
jgi:hypothetical protein